MVVLVVDEQGAVRRQGQILGAVESSLQGGTAVAGIADLAGAGDRVDDAVCIHATNPVVRAVGDVQRPVVGDSDSVRLVDRGVRCGSTVAGKTGLAGAGHRVDDAVRAHAAYPLVSPVRHVDRAVRCGRHVHRPVEARRGRLIPIPRPTGHPRACEGSDDAIRGNDADTMVLRIGDVEIARAVAAESLRVVQPRTGGGAAVPRVASPPRAGD